MYIYIYIYNAVTWMNNLTLMCCSKVLTKGLQDGLGEHKPGRIKPGRIKRAALSLQNQKCYYFVFFDTTPFICL